MFTSDENIKLFLGLKVKQLRTQLNMQQSELAKCTGVSVSYVNEIEKGKKFPKPDKILLLAKYLGVTYDDLVSLKVDKNLMPITQLLESAIMRELPLELFGIDKVKLIELIAKAPAKINAFISTLIEIARSYNLTHEHFYFAALRSYQEMHENYFDDIENEAEQFALQHRELIQLPVKSSSIVPLLTQHFNYKIEDLDVKKMPELTQIRSIYLPEKRKLLINSYLADNQKTFILGKELGYCKLGLTDRAFTTPWQKASSFEQVLANMKASYFSGALLIPKSQLISDLHLFLNNAEWRPELFLRLLEKYNSSPEMFMHRLTNILPTHFGLKSLFFLRFNYDSEFSQYELTKELHLTQLHNPHANSNHENYCRRWLATRIFDELEFKKLSTNDTQLVVAAAQRSRFENSGIEYFNITLARFLKRTPQHALSVTIGFQLNDDFKKKVRFWNSQNVADRLVNLTCERCGIQNCESRRADSKVLNQTAKLEEIEKSIAALNKP